MAEGIQHAGKFLIVLGVIVIALGALLLISGKIPWIGRLPGDILIQKKNYTIYVPLATSIIISLIITFIFWLIGKR
jgi:hydrogenase-4 membrane subunit HyfE